MTMATIAIRHIRRMVASGFNYGEAARDFIRQCPSGAFELAEDLGTYPSSEPELAAFQREWAR